MPTNIRIIHAREFIKATSEGQLNFDRAKEILREIASTEDPSFDYDVILDVRKAQSELSTTDLWNLAAELSNVRKAFSRKTAVLCPLERFDHAGFFALCAQNRGFRVKAFTSFEDAIDWIIGMEPDA
jgi:hypothetical protein